MPIKSDTFPCDYYIPLTNDTFREGRITVNRLSDHFYLEVDIVQKDSRKIFYHIGVFDCPKELDFQEALDYGHQKMAHFLRSISD